MWWNSESRILNWNVFCYITKKITEQYEILRKEFRINLAPKN